MNRLLGIAVILASLGNLCAPATPITALTFSRDGLTLVSSGRNRVDLRSADDAAIRDSIGCDFPRVTSLAFTADGRLVVGGGTPGVSGAVSLFELKTKKMLRQISGCSDLVASVAGSPNGQWIAIGSADHSAAIHPVGTNSSGSSIQLVGHSGAILAIAFTPGSDFVITASADRSIKVWTLEGKLVRSLNHHTEAVSALAIRPQTDSSQVECASSSDDGTVRIWQPEIGRMIRIIRGTGPVFALAYTPMGNALFAAGKEGILRRLDVESDQIFAQQPAHSDVIYSVAISPNGRKLATGDWAGNIRLWNLTEAGSLAAGSK